MFANGISRLKKEFLILPQEEIAKKYLNVDYIPSLIASPLRRDRKPSLSVFYSSNRDILCKDFSTGEVYTLYRLLAELWKVDVTEVMRRINREFNFLYIPKPIPYKPTNTVDIQIQERAWEDYDKEYWSQFGITIHKLKWANVVPISKYSISREYPAYYIADKLAYAYIYERDGKKYYKIYQPYSTERKWRGNYDKDMVSLYDQLPKTHDTLIITSSLKDSLTIISQLKIPCINLQGEGYEFPQHLVDILKERFTNIYVLYDRDEAGITHGKRVAKETGFKYIELPNINNTKDVSDLYRSLDNKQDFKNIINQLTNY